MWSRTGRRSPGNGSAAVTVWVPADSQVPWGEAALDGAVTDPARQTKPSWYLVTTKDRMIPPSAQHTMAERIGATLPEVAASHSVYLSQPEAVATLISQAAVGAAER
jgi:hypothetical protein